MPILRITAIWFLILLLAIANGALREELLMPALGVPAAPMLSGVLLGSAIFLCAWFLLPRAKSSGEPWTIGSSWLVLTLVFEFAFGRLVAGKSWPDLFAPYRFENGNLWPLILLLTFLAPSLVARWRPHSSDLATLGPRPLCPESDLNRMEAGAVLFSVHGDTTDHPDDQQPAIDHRASNRPRKGPRRHAQ